MVNKNLKKIALLFTLYILSVALYAQKDVTQFLGIPVDGSKYEMIQKLKSKGFTNSQYDKDILIGEFNGTDVEILIATNNNKVYRIMVADAYPRSEVDIKIRFNRLCHQFENNEKYIQLSSDCTIPNDEDISHEMSVNNKRYEAVYCQLPPVGWEEKMRNIFLSKYTEEQLSNPTEELLKELENEMLTYMDTLSEKYEKNSVWFMISEDYGEYRILMYYDNEYNSANGEDL